MKNMNAIRIAAVAGLVVAPELARAKWVRPEIGTGGDGHTFPGATYPFGLVQPSPDTGRTGYRYCAGYRWEDDRIFGASAATTQ